jgi:triosephosphate isomerase
MANETGRGQRTLLIAGNWKMHGTLNSLEHFSLRLAERVHEPQAELLVFPAAVHLAAAVRSFRGQKVGIGAQDLHEEALGAYTGNVSGEMIHDLGVRWVLIGHSERRSLHGEDDEVVTRKVLAALRAGLHPVLCVGENRDEREAGQAETRVAGQVGVVLQALGAAAFSELTIAYEPVWAIGTGLTATPDQAQAMHAAIRAQLAAADPALAEGMRILYGGSVKADNAEHLFGCPDIDGALIGGASLEADSFADIIAAADAVSQN